MKPAAALIFLVFLSTHLPFGNASAEEAVAESQSVEEARALHSAGQSHYERGEYALALEQFEAAHEAYPVPGFLFNIGQCYRNLGDHERALAHFEMYLEQLPDAPNRSAVEELIARSRHELERQEAEEAHNEPTAGNVEEGLNSGGETPPVRTPAYRRWWFWTIVTAVVAGAAVGISVPLGRSEQGSLEIPNGSLGNLDLRGE